MRAFYTTLNSIFENVSCTLYFAWFGIHTVFERLIKFIICAREHNIFEPTVAKVIVKINVVHAVTSTYIYIQNARVI